MSSKFFFVCLDIYFEFIFDSINFCGFIKLFIYYDDILYNSVWV